MAEGPVEAAARAEAVAAEEAAVEAAEARTVTVNGSQALVLLP